jgi:hypothetical protein
LNKKVFRQNFVLLAHSEKCGVAKTSLCSILKHFEPIFVKKKQKMHQKPQIYIIKPKKIALWAKISKSRLGNIF